MKTIAILRAREAHYRGRIVERHVTGRPTVHAAEVAYHLDQVNRGYLKEPKDEKELRDAPPQYTVLRLYRRRIARARARLARIARTKENTAITKMLEAENV